MAKHDPAGVDCQKRAKLKPQNNDCSLGRGCLGWERARGVVDEKGRGPGGGVWVWVSVSVWLFGASLLINAAATVDRYEEKRKKKGSGW